MELEELYKVRIEMRNQVSSRRLELRELELNLETIEIQIEEGEKDNGIELHPNVKTVGTVYIEDFN